MFDDKNEEQKALSEWAKTLDKSSYLYISSLFNEIDLLRK